MAQDSDITVLSLRVGEVERDIRDLRRDMVTWIESSSIARQHMEKDVSELKEELKLLAKQHAEHVENQSQTIHRIFLLLCVIISLLMIDIETIKSAIYAGTVALSSKEMAQEVMEHMGHVGTSIIRGVGTLLAAWFLFARSKSN